MLLFWQHTVFITFDCMQEIRVLSPSGLWNRGNFSPWWNNLVSFQELYFCWSLTSVVFVIRVRGIVCVAFNNRGFFCVFTYRHLNTRGVVRIRDSYANPRRSPGLHNCRKFFFIKSVTPSLISLHFTSPSTAHSITLLCFALQYTV